MKKVIFFMIAALLFGAKEASAQADKIIGTYWSPQKDGKVEIFKQGNKYYGKIIWSSNPRKDAKNPKPELRSREIVGMTFLTDFKFDDDEYIDGEIYDPKSGKTYSCKMWLDGSYLHVKGYIGISLLGRTEKFERIN
ncbi:MULTISPECIES: DUF2147 domain-containing protein [unclassified Paraflavitalea]|uniref:DUF2147 domain-containing protein n=1 Tax=unclassified Paraflavitalea TaxID=2798305 RepID=UPI003D34641E